MSRIEQQESINNQIGQSSAGLEPTELDAWAAMAIPYERIHAAESTNFVEITRIPKKIEPRALTSMIIAGSQVVPKQTEICFKGDTKEPVGLVEFKTPVDAHRAIERIRMSRFGRQWQVKFVKDPKFADPEKDEFEKWLR